MSDFDRNVAADRGGYAGSAVAIDAGLRAHMIRVYNYMASAVALTGVVAYITFTMSVVTNSAGAVTGFTPLGTFLFSGIFMWVLMLAPLALVFFISFRINSLDAGTARLLFFVYAALLGVSLATIFITFTSYGCSTSSYSIRCRVTGRTMSTASYRVVCTLYLYGICSTTCFCTVTGICRT